MGIVQCLPLYYFTEHPIMLQNTAGEKGEYPQNSERVKSCSKRHFHPFLSVYLIKSKQGRKRNTSQPLPLCSYKEYRGSAHRAKGLEYKQDPPIPPLSGGEVARKTEEKGRGLSERSEFRRPRRRLRRRTQKPDNSGGASWFVLLAVEKNEQIT